MFEDGTVIIGVLGLLFAGVGVTFCLVLLKRVRGARRALARGTEVEARCLDTYVSQPGGNGGGRGVRHVILGFRTLEGRDVRFEDLSGVPRVLGDRVRVRYLPEDPQQAAVTDANPYGGAGRTVLFVAFPLAFACVGLWFAAVGFGLVDFHSHPDLPSVQPSVSASPSWPWLG
ncbi:DUF3592 domain-containing protein [Kitasatospora sp. NPDC004289]